MGRDEDTKRGSYGLNYILWNQSATPSFTAAYIMVWFAFTMPLATWS